MPRNRKATLLNDAGFTLLEIIAVMVIMSILAVVAVPKYFDLQTKAKEKALETAMAEAIGRVNGYFALEVLSGTAIAAIDYETGEPLGSDLGDFTLTVDDGTGFAEGSTTPLTSVTCQENATVADPGCLLLTITAVAGKAVDGATIPSRHMPRPGI